MGNVNLHYQDGEDRIKRGSISIADMIAIEEQKLEAKPLWEADIIVREKELAKLKDFDYWFQTVYTPNKLRGNE